jgi:sugar O-acyltransferase (sialic acid O-acetyltransferase NeuD family)
VAESGLNLLIWGGGGHGRVVADLVRATGNRVAGYADQDRTKLGREVEPGGGRVIIDQRELEACLSETRCPPGVDAVVLAMGNNVARARCLELLQSLAAEALIHPSAVVSPSARIGRGTVVFPSVIVNAGARIGAGVILNTRAVVEHDCLVEDGAHLSPGAVLNGGVHIGKRSWIGAASVVIPNLEIGADAVVGAGAVVIRDVAESSTVVGNPAR